MPGITADEKKVRKPRRKKMTRGDWKRMVFLSVYGVVLEPEGMKLPGFRTEKQKAARRLAHRNRIRK